MQQLLFLGFKYITKYRTVKKKEVMERHRDNKNNIYTLYILIFLYTVQVNYIFTKRRSAVIGSPGRGDLPWD